MSDFSLTLVLQIKTSKIINDMAKVQQKSEKISAFGGIFFVLDKFDRILSSVIDSHLGLRSRLITRLYGKKTDRHVSNGGKIRPLKNYLRILGTTSSAETMRLPKTWPSYARCWLHAGTMMSIPGTT